MRQPLLLALPILVLLLTSPDLTYQKKGRFGSRMPLFQGFHGEREFRFLAKNSNPGTQWRVRMRESSYYSRLPTGLASPPLPFRHDVGGQVPKTEMWCLYLGVSRRAPDLIAHANKHEAEGGGSSIFRNQPHEGLMRGQNSCWRPKRANFVKQTPWGAPTAIKCDAMQDRTGTQYAAKVRSKTDPMGGWLLGCIRNLAAKVHAQADAMVTGKGSPVITVRDGLVSKAMVSSTVSSKTALRRLGSRSGRHAPQWTAGVISRNNPMEQPIGCTKGHLANSRNKPHRWPDWLPELTP
jgi:hypothetical protein